MREMAPLLMGQPLFGSRPKSSSYHHPSLISVLHNLWRHQIWLARPPRPPLCRLPMGRHFDSSDARAFPRHFSVHVTPAMPTISESSLSTTDFGSEPTRPPASVAEQESKWYRRDAGNSKQRWISHPYAIHSIIHVC